MVVSRLPVRPMNSASAATSVRMCCASISTASDEPDTSVDVVAANVPAPCSKGRNGPMNTSARSSAAVEGEPITTIPLEESSGSLFVDSFDPKEILDVASEFNMVLKQEPVRGVGVDLDLRARNQSGE